MHTHLRSRQCFETRNNFDYFDFLFCFLNRSFMKMSHCNIPEAVKIHQDIKAKKSLAIHWGTFKLSYEVNELGMFLMQQQAVQLFPVAKPALSVRRCKVKKLERTFYLFFLIFGNFLTVKRAVCPPPPFVLPSQATLLLVSIESSQQ